MANRTTRAPSQRQLRVGELIRHALAEILQRGRIHDPALDGVAITVSEVRMTPDLRTATVFLMPLGGEGVAAILEALERERRDLRREIGRRLDLRYTPDLRFRADPSFDEGAHIDALLRSPKVRRDLGGDTDGDGS